jgi:hypothetical protein
MDKEKQNIIDTSKEVGLQVNAEKTKSVLLSRYQNAGQYYDTNIANRSFGNVVEFKYLGKKVTNQNLIQGKLRGD